MRPLLRLALIAAIGIIPTVFAGSLVSAQSTPEPSADPVAGCEGGREPDTEEREMLRAQDGNEYLAWQGVCRPISENDASIEPEELEEMLPELSGLEGPLQLPETILAEIEAASGDDRVLQPYAVGFQEGFATVPRIVPEILSDEDEGIEPEFMLVFVRRGEFVLDLFPNAQQPAREIYVWTAGSEIQTMTPWDMSANPDEPHYTPEAGVVLTNDDGSNCIQGCLVTEEVPVLLQPGDFAIAQSGAICTYCLAQGAIDGSAVPLLEVYAGIAPIIDEGTPVVSPDVFSWTRSWDYIQANREKPRPEVRTTEAPVMLGWALPNLATGCKDG